MNERAVRADTGMIWRLPRWSWAPIAIGLVFSVLLTTLTLGIRVPGLGLLGLFPGAEAFDYSGVPFDFTPLNNIFIDDVLGNAEVTSTTKPRVSAISPRSIDIKGLPTRYTDPHALTNDRFSSARDVPSVPYRARTDTHGSTRTADDPNACGSVGNTVWYRYRAPSNESLIVNTVGSDFATTLGVFTGRQGTLTNVGCDTDPYGNALIQFQAVKGTMYFFQIAGPAGDGHLMFDIDPPGDDSLESESSPDQPANDSSIQPAISADGRYIAFSSLASDLPRDADPTPCPAREPSHQSEEKAADTAYYPSRYCAEVYVRDRSSGSIRIASVSSEGTPANGWSGDLDISADGRYVAFGSDATNLVPDDSNDLEDVFVHDMVTGRTDRVSVGPDGAQSSALPVEVPDLNDQGGNADYRGINVADSTVPAISDDGRMVAFASRAALVPEDTNNDWDVYVHDRVTRSTYLASVDSQGKQGPRASGWSSWFLLGTCISPDGRFVAFGSNSTLVQHDTNKSGDVFVRDLRAGRTSRVSVSSKGHEASKASLVTRDCFSADDRRVVFMSTAQDLVDSDTNTAVPGDVFVHDMVTGSTIRASVATNGQGWGEQGKISRNGRYVIFASDGYDGNIDANYANARLDVWVRDLLTETTEAVTLPLTHEGGRTDREAQQPAISADGRVVIYELHLWTAECSCPAPASGTQTQIYSSERWRAS